MPCSPYAGEHPDFNFFFFFLEHLDFKLKSTLVNVIMHELLLFKNPQRLTKDIIALHLVIFKCMKKKEASDIHLDQIGREKRDGPLPWDFWKTIHPLEVNRVDLGNISKWQYMLYRIVPLLKQVICHGPWEDPMELLFSPSDSSVHWLCSWLGIRQMFLLNLLFFFQFSFLSPSLRSQYGITREEGSNVKNTTYVLNYLWALLAPGRYSPIPSRSCTC